MKNNYSSEQFSFPLLTFQHVTTAPCRIQQENTRHFKTSSGNRNIFQSHDRKSTGANGLREGTTIREVITLLPTKEKETFETLNEKIPVSLCSRHIYGKKEINVFHKMKVNGLDTISNLK